VMVNNSLPAGGIKKGGLMSERNAPA